ncbi:MAG: phage holin family protein [Nocardioidaceae bacterium]|nr:phage holin family protein [Nocardioidaceae bacterium]
MTSTPPGAHSATGASRAAPSESPESEEQSLGGIVSRISSDFSQLVRQEIELAKLEMKEEGKKAGKAAGMLGGAAFAGWMFAIFASATLMWALNHLMDIAWAALIVALLWGVAAAVLAIQGRNKMREVNPKPEQTAETLKEDAQWLKAQKR